MPGGVPWLAGGLLFASVLMGIAFMIYGFNAFHLMVRSRRYKGVKAAPLSTRPSVAIHLPVYNELYVVERLISSCVRAAIRYGPDRVRIVVIDDSTDETNAAIDGAVARYSAEGIRFDVIRRGTRQGFKAGALQAALGTAEEKYIVVLDADFVIPADFLESAVAPLERDSSLGFVQAKWGHLDRNHNVVTESAAIGLDAHFLLEQKGRNGSGYLMNFNGSAGVLRTEAMRAAGGWAPDTLAEDLDLSYRIQLAGYRALFLSDTEVPAELPPTIAGLKRQQGRWARGSIQTAKKLLPKIGVSKRLSFSQKLEASIHLTYYLVHPLMVASFLLAVATAFLSINVTKYGVSVSLPSSVQANQPGTAPVSFEVVPWVVFSALVVLSTLAVLTYCFEAVRAQDMGLFERIKQISLLVVIGYGISISNSVQVIGGLLSSQTGNFSRTPKYAIAQDGTWKDKRYQISYNRITLLEAGAVVLASVALLSAIRTGNLGLAPILLVYLLGYSFVLYLAVVQNRGTKGLKDS